MILVTVKELSQLRHLIRETSRLRQRLGGFLLSGGDTRRASNMLRRLQAQERERDRLEGYINSVEDTQVRMLLELRFIEGLSWTNVAVRMGGGNTEDSARKACFRYLQEH